MLGCGGGSSPGGSDGGFAVTLGALSTFATHGQFASLGFEWGPPDGTMGAIVDGGAYTFFGSAKGSSSCAGSPNIQGAYRVTGSLEALSGLPPTGCKALLMQAPLRRVGFSTKTTLEVVPSFPSCPVQQAAG